MTKTRVCRERFRSLYEKGASFEELSAEFGITDRYARVLRDRMGLPLRRSEETRRARPKDFEAVVEKIGVSKARKHFNASWNTVSRWCDEAGIERVRHCPTPVLRTIAMPEGFAEAAPSLFKHQLASQFGISLLMVRRLLDIHGLKSRATVHELAKDKPKAVTIKGLKSSPFRVGTGDVAPAANDNRDVYDRAARHLRRTFSNIFRCDIRLYISNTTTYGEENNLPNKGRNHYFVAGLGIIERENLLNIAVQKGFEPDALDRNFEVA